MPAPRQFDYEEMRAKYEAGDGLEAMAAHFRCSRFTIQKIASTHYWKRPMRPRGGESVSEIYADFMAGMKLKDMAVKHGRTFNSVKSLVASYGWRRSGDEGEDDPIERKDPLGEALAAAGYQRHVATPSRWSSRAVLPAWGAR